MRFSERMGHRPVKSALQIDSMDADLRNGLWNAFRPIFVDLLGHNTQQVRDKARQHLAIVWDELLKLPTDEAPEYSDHATRLIKPIFGEGNYLDVYDLIDFTVCRFDLKGLDARYNEVLEREVSGYRFIDGVLAPISNEYEIAAIEEGLVAASKMPGAAQHLQSALKYLSDRESPDYRNSIKESISAVEAAARAITGKPKATLGDLLPVLQESGHVHPAQREAFAKLYGYTSDEGGIRHAMTNPASVDFADAKYMLSVCAAFIAYLAQRL